MKIKGKSLDRPQPELVVLPRGDSQLVFKVGPILNNDQFDELCPVPKPPMIQKPGEDPRPHLEDVEYLAKCNTRSERRFDWMLITSLNYTEDLEWEKVQLTNPDTYHLWKEELLESGLLMSEINHITNNFYIANNMSEGKLNEARARFLASTQGQKAK